jgi:hypothetical protein
MTPKTTITKVDGQTGVVRPGSEGILAILAGSSTGALDTPSSYTRDTLIPDDLGYGRLTSFGAHDLATAKKPVLLNRTACSTAGAYGAVTLSGTGASTPTADGTSLPFDDFLVRILIVAGGTVGTPGITYQTSVDDGVTYGPVTALGSATYIEIANTGVKINLTVDTLVADDEISCTTTGPRPTSADLVASLEALRVTSQPWEAVLIDGDSSAAAISLVSSWLTTLEDQGKYKTAIMSFRRRADGESRADYLTAYTAVRSQVSSLGIVLCYDGGDAVDRFLGVALFRPAGLHVAARGMAVDIATDVAYVALGPLPNCVIKDSRKNPLYHDEALYPGADDQQATALRSFDGQTGAYVNNANLISPSGSDYVYWQHARVMNRLAEVARQRFDQNLSRGVAKSKTTGPKGERYIAETDAQAIEGDINAALLNPSKGRVSEVRVTLHRDDDISSNGGAIVKADLEVVALAYVKGWDVAAKYVKTITSGPVGG